MLRLRQCSAATRVCGASFRTFPSLGVVGNGYDNRPKFQSHSSGLMVSSMPPASLSPTHLSLDLGRTAPPQRRLCEHRQWAAEAAQTHWTTMCRRHKDHQRVNKAARANKQLLPPTKLWHAVSPQHTLLRVILPSCADRTAIYISQ